LIVNDIFFFFMCNFAHSSGHFTITTGGGPGRGRAAGARGASAQFHEKNDWSFCFWHPNCLLFGRPGYFAVHFSTGSFLFSCSCYFFFFCWVGLIVLSIRSRFFWSVLPRSFHFFFYGGADCGKTTSLDLFFFFLGGKGHHGFVWPTKF